MKVGRVLNISEGDSQMAKVNLLDGKRILLVDDELDILDSLELLLPICDIAKASSFHSAKELLEKEKFDLAILDIMGVNGYELLELANKRKVTAVMLTAHALSVEDTKKSAEMGAAFYIPKDEIAGIATFLNDVLQAKNKGKNSWKRWIDRLGWYFDNRFGPDWKDADKEFWGRILGNK